jgi:hypothetical protein
VAMQNLTNPMMMKGPTREVYPLGCHEISVAIPEGRTFATARLLAAGVKAYARADGDRVIVAVPTIDLVEVVHITWA